jgi:hypothetical protein
MWKPIAQNCQHCQRLKIISFLVIAENLRHILDCLAMVAILAIWLLYGSLAAARDFQKRPPFRLSEPTFGKKSSRNRSSPVNAYFTTAPLLALTKTP